MILKTKDGYEVRCPDGMLYSKVHGFDKACSDHGDMIGPICAAFDPKTERGERRPATAEETLYAKHFNWSAHTVETDGVSILWLDAKDRRWSTQYPTPMVALREFMHGIGVNASLGRVRRDD